MTKTHRLFFVISALILAALACARTSASAPVSPSRNLPAGETIRKLMHEGLERSYILYVPASINWNQPVPLVFVFHGGTGNAESAIRMSGFNKVADEHGFLLVYPNGTSRVSNDILLTWNGGNCCGYAQQNNVDDVGFVRAIIDDMQSQANIDPKRIYASGMSNGGILSQRLACEAADVFAAIAPVSGTLNFSACNPTQLISVIQFHGTSDQHIPYDGGYGPKSLVNVDFASVKYSVGFWTSFNKCNSQPQTDSAGDIKHETWTGCKASTSVELYTINGGGHAWPGGVAVRTEADPPTQSISASQLIWKFFSAHPKP